MSGFVALRLLTLRERTDDARDALVAALRRATADLAGAVSGWIAPVAPTAVINAGDIVWRTVFASEGAALAAASTPAWRTHVAPLLENVGVTHLGYRITRSGRRPGGAGIWRALIFRCFAHADPATVRALGEATLLLPRYVAEIRSWALSPVAYTEGVKQFDYVWEQEFDRLDDLTGPYMASPAHWGVVDAFFDADCPEYIVDPHLTQVVGTIESSIL